MKRELILGNHAIARGAWEAGVNFASGYPGTPSTEIIDKCLSKVQDKIKVGWSVNEAVSVAVGIGYSIAGFDSVVTMKTNGLVSTPISTPGFLINV